MANKKGTLTIAVGDYDKKATKVVIPEGVKKIGKQAFDGYTSLTSVTIPGSVKKIDDSAFKGCTSLASVVIPENVKEIGENAFSGCTSLASVVIPESMKEIKYTAFRDCISLSEIRFDGSVAQWKKLEKKLYQTMERCYMPSDLLMNWDEGARWFKNTIATCVKCADGNVPIPQYSIKDDLLITCCRAVSKVIIPTDVKRICSNSFYDLTSLTSVTIHEGVKRINEHAFEGCVSLSEFRFDGTVAQWEKVEKGDLWFNHTAADCVKCTDGDVPLPKYVIKRNVLELWPHADTEAIIPEGVKEIGNDAFAELSSLVSVVIPESVKKIGENAFRWCPSLASVTIPEGVKEIAFCLFGSCTSLASITIPSSVKRICEGAFDGCTSLSEIRFGGTMEQWDKIRKIDDLGIDVPARVVQCSDGYTSFPW